MSKKQIENLEEIYRFRFNKKKDFRECNICGGTGIDNRCYPSIECENCGGSGKI